MTAETIPNMIEYSKRLEAAGFTTQQALIQSEALYTVIEEKLLTKQDFQSFIKNEFEPKMRSIDARFEHLENKFEAKFDRVDNRFQEVTNEFGKLRNEMKDMKHDLKSWFGRCMLAYMTFMSGLIAVMHFIK